MYVMVVNFGIEGKHMSSVPGAGTVILRVRAKAFARDKVFDTVDIRWPEIEPTGGFLLTKQIAVKGQMYGNCVDFDNPKRCPCDHAKGETCAGDYCIVPAWCPSLGDSNVIHPPRAQRLSAWKVWRARSCHSKPGSHLMTYSSPLGATLE